jgi:hypothetical protein
VVQVADKKSFVLYTEYEENLEELPDEELGQLFRAIFSYVNRGVVPELSASCRMAFSFIRKDLDRNQAKYEETCRRRAEAGVKSGEARRAKAKRAEQTGTNQTNVHFVQQAGTNRTDNDNVNENENVNDNDNGNGNENVNGNVGYKPHTAGSNPFHALLTNGRV